MKRRILISIILCLNACGETPKNKSNGMKATTSVASTTMSQYEMHAKAEIKEPTQADRKITVKVFDPNKKPDFLVKKFDGTNLTIGQTIKKVQPLTYDQNVAIQCDGGYNKQPPLYSLGFDLISRQKVNDDFINLPDDSSLHEVCMLKAVEHLNKLRAQNDPDLKYYIQPE